MKTMITEYQIVIRLLLASFLGSIVGFERERAGKVAGLRTHALTAMGSSLLSLISLWLYYAYPSIGGAPGFDYHIVANVIVGIGFIGGGAIIRYSDRIVGTTTAASLFTVAAVGLATGLGMYFAATVTTLICFLLLILAIYVPHNGFLPESRESQNKDSD